MIVSKLKPRFERGRVRVAILTSQHISQHDKDRKSTDEYVNRPSDIDSLPVMLHQVGPQIKDGDAQSVDGMEQAKDKHENLKKPVAKNGIDRIHPRQHQEIECKEDE